MDTATAARIRTGTDAKSPQRCGAVISRATCGPSRGRLARDTDERSPPVSETLADRAADGGLWRERTQSCDASLNPFASCHDKRKPPGS